MSHDAAEQATPDEVIFTQDFDTNSHLWQESVRSLAPRCQPQPQLPYRTRPMLLQTPLTYGRNPGARCTFNIKNIGIHADCALNFKGSETLDRDTRYLRRELFSVVLLILVDQNEVNSEDFIQTSVHVRSIAIGNKSPTLCSSYVVLTTTRTHAPRTLP